MAKASAKKQKQSSVTAPATRAITEVEKEYFREHFAKDKLTANDVRQKMPDVSSADVDAFIATLLPRATPDEKPEERMKKIAESGMKAGNFMGRRDGIAVMTQAASEISDAKKVVEVPSVDTAARSQPDRIFVMNPDKRIR